MTFKCTLFMQLATNTSNPTAPARRLGGWSESYYFPGTDSNALLNAITGADGKSTGLAPARAALLPNGSAIVGARTQLVSPTIGGAQSLALSLPGDAGLVADVPQMALLFKVPANGTPNIRKVVLRGIPDARVVDGEYSPSNDYNLKLINFFAVLQNSWAFRGRDLTQPALKIISITSAGLVSTEQPSTFVVPQMVKVLKTMTSTGAQKGGRFQVTTTGPLTTNFTLLNWNLGATTGGQVRSDATIFPLFALATFPGRIITRRVGRPFVQYRGRRSARRR